MALTRFGFIVTGKDLAPATHTVVMQSPSFRMTAVGVATPADGIAVAQQMVRDGIQLIEVCGGFGPVWTGKIIEAIGGAVPVGSVGYGPESTEQLHAIFA